MQRAQIEAAIKEEFQKLHQFLRDEENARLNELNQEEETKTQVMGKKIEDLEEQMKTLETTISGIDAALGTTNLPFLKVHLLLVSADWFLWFSVVTSITPFGLRLIAQTWL